MTNLKRLWRRVARESVYAEPARTAYLRVVEAARQPVHYMQFGVPDTVDGRFEMIVLYAVLLVRRIKAKGEASDRFGREFMSHLFDDMDRNLREMGTGDMRVGKRIKQMAEAFYGRAGAYQAALDGAGDDLAAVLSRNVYTDGDPGDASVAAFAAAVQRQAAGLDAQDLDEILKGRVSFTTPGSGSA